MSDLLNAAPAAGWYPDPITEAQLRWWDGEGWTERTSDGSAVAAEPAVEVAEPEVLVIAPAAAPSMDNAAPRSRRDVHPRLAPNTVVATRTPVAPPEGPIDYSASVRVEPVVPLLPERSSTPAVWGLAFLPWIVQVVGFVVGFATVSPLSLVGAAGAAIVLLLTIALVVRDRRQLDALGHIGPASAWWILLAPPLAYLIARTVSTYRNNGKGAAPLVVYLVNSVVVTGVSVGLVVLFPEVFGVVVGG